MNKDELKQLCDKFIDDLYGLDDYPNKERLVVEAFARALVVRALEKVKAECLVRHGGCVEAGKLAVQSEDIKKWEASTNALYWMSEWIGDEIQRITEGA